MTDTKNDATKDLEPKTPPPSSRVPKVLSEIHRATSRVGARNKNESGSLDTRKRREPLEVTRIIRENTHRRCDVSVCLRVVLCLLLIVNCVFLVRIDDGIRTGGVNTGLGIWTNKSPPPPLPSPPPPPPPSPSLLSPPPPTPHPSPHPPPPPPTPHSSPPPPLVIARESLEYKSIVWDSASQGNLEDSFTEVLKDEEISDDEISTCSYGSSSGVSLSWNSASIKSRTCVLMLLINKLAQDGWEMVGLPEYGSDDYSVITFTRPSSAGSSRTPSPVVSGTVPLNDNTFYTAVRMCLDEEPYFGLCENEGASTGFGTMPNWNTSLITTMKGLFQNNYNFNGDLSAWDTSSVIDMSEMFQSALALVNPKIGSWDTSQVTSMASMFYSASSFNANLTAWDTSRVKDMSLMFNSASSFNQDISSWNTSQVTDMGHIFKGAFAFDKNTAGWNKAKVININTMYVATITDENFSHAIQSCLSTNPTYGRCSFNQYGPISDWDVSRVTTMQNASYGKSSFNGDILSWNTSQVKNMNSMFRGCTNFNQDIGSWSTSQVTDTSSMFYGANTFNQEISGWDTCKVSTMNSMFYSAHNFNQAIGSWNTSEVVDMGHMFYDAGNFNQYIGD